MMRPRTAICTLFAALLAAGCASFDGIAPKAQRTDAASLAAGATLADAKLTTAAWPEREWWQRFGDPQLNALIAEALAGNPGMGSARARVDRALALAAGAGAAQAPQVNAGANLTRQRYSSNDIFPPPIGGSWYTHALLTATLDYEFDLWGRNRAGYEAALGQARAAEVDAYAVRLLLAANVARAYAQLGRSFEQLDLARAVLAQRQSMLELTRERVAAGLDSDVELKHAEGSIPAARQRIVQLQEEIALERNLLAALLGQGPDRGLAIARPQLQAPSMALPSVLPADLLGRRPDVVAQRWRVESAHSSIASAKAQFYPNVNLTALIGVHSVSFADLLTHGSAIPAIGPALRLPLFDGGYLRGNLAAKSADFDLAVEQYNQTLVEALREVVDQLASLKSVDAQRVEVERALAAARDAYALANTRYHAGIASYLQVLAAETPLLEQQSLRAGLRARELELSINLIRALGGGYGEADAAPAS